MVNLLFYSGHNGLKSILSYFNGDNRFKRLLIGISRPDSKNPEVVSNYVLSPFKKRELEELHFEVFPKALKMVEEEFLIDK